MSFKGLVAWFLISLFGCFSLPALAQTGYVSNSSDDTVSVIELASETVIATIPVGDGPRRIQIGPASGLVYVTNFSSDSISIIDPTILMVVDTIPVGINPGEIVFPLRKILDMLWVYSPVQYMLLTYLLTPSQQLSPFPLLLVL